MRRSIAKNTAYMTTASVLQKVVAFVYFTLVARTIGAEDTGKYVLALSFTTIFVVFVDLGFTNVLIREAAKFKDKLQTFISTILSVKLILGILTYIAAVFTVNIMGYEPEIRHLVYLSAVTMLFDSFHLSLYGVLRSMGDLRWEAGSILATQVTTLVLGSIFLLSGLPLIYLILAFTIPSALNFLFVTFILQYHYNIKVIPKFHKETFLYIGAIAIPFAIAAIFARVYSYIDTIILSRLLDTVAVGQYGIATKITFAFQFIPLALVAAVYPRFSEYYIKNKERLAYLFEQSVKYLLLIALPIAVGIGLLAKDIVLTLYTTEYLAAVLPLQILMCSLVFSFVSFPIGAMLNACDKQNVQTAIVALILIINITLNVALIPTLGIVGAAVAACAGNMLLSVLGYLIIPTITPISHGFLIKTKIQLLVSVCVMAMLVWYINQYQHFIVSIGVGVVTYPAMLFVTRAVTLNQIKEIKQLLGR